MTRTGLGTGAVLCALLAGCSSGGGGGGSDLPRQVALLERFVDEVDSVRAPEPDELTGSVEMTGLMGLDIREHRSVPAGEDRVILGDARMTFDFDRSSISGRAGNFSEFGGPLDAETPEDVRLIGTYAGQLRVTESDITDEFFDARFEGVISGERDFGRGEESFIAAVTADADGAVGIQEDSGRFFAGSDLATEIDFSTERSGDFRESIAAEDGFLILAE